MSEHEVAIRAVVIVVTVVGVRYFTGAARRSHDKRSLSMEGLSPAHLLLILVIALLVIGPGRLPETGAAVGKAMREFRSAIGGKDEPPAA